MVVIAHIVMIATYSPSMYSRYGVEPYSTMKPATSSDSASTRSNGGRLVSASAEIKNTTNIGSSVSQCQSRNELAEAQMRAKAVLLRVDDCRHVQRSNAQQHANDDEADGDFIARPSAPPSAARP